MKKLKHILTFLLILIFSPIIILYEIIKEAWEDAR